jgi:hypothetical protein
MTYDDGTSVRGDVLIGCQVMSTDGEELGTVKQVEGNFFEVDAPVQPSFWLPTSAIASRMGQRVTLIFQQESLDHYRSEPPLAA